jgi:hypothetical protein
MSDETVLIEDDAFCVSQRLQEAEIQIRGDGAERRLVIYTSNHDSDSCFVELGMANARALRDWLNAKDLAD